MRTYRPGRTSSNPRPARAGRAARRRRPGWPRTPCRASGPRSRRASRLARPPPAWAVGVEGGHQRLGRRPRPPASSCAPCGSRTLSTLNSAMMSPLSPGANPLPRNGARSMTQPSHRPHRGLVLPAVGDAVQARAGARASAARDLVRVGAERRTGVAEAERGEQFGRGRQMRHLGGPVHEPGDPVVAALQVVGTWLGATTFCITVGRPIAGRRAAGAPAGRGAPTPRRRLAPAVARAPSRRPSSPARRSGAGQLRADRACPG